MATVEHEEWKLSTSTEDPEQVVLRYKDPTTPERVVVVDPLDRGELVSLHEALGAFLGLPKGSP